MNFKQKLGYMAIGSLFTLVGYLLATLGAGGFNPQNATAQDNMKQVIDEIITRKLKVVNSEGKTIAILGEDESGNGTLVIFNKASGSRVECEFDKNGDGRMFITNKSDKVVAALGALDGNGGLAISNKVGKPVMSWNINKNGDGRLFIGNKSGKPVVGLSALDGHGTLLINNKSGKFAAALSVNDYEGGILSIANKNEIGVVTLEATLGDHGRLSVSNEKGISGITLAGASSGGRYLPTVQKAREREGKKGATLSPLDYTTSAGGVLSIHNKNGIEVATLGTSTLDGGILSIYSKEGKVASRVGIDTYGWGGFQYFKGKWRTY